MSAQWFYRVFDQEFGPVSIEELRQLAVNGIVASDSEVRSTESVDWVAAGTIKELGLQGVAKTPAPPVVGKTGSDPDLGVAKGADDWFYRRGEREFGPVSFDALLELARTEQVGADDSIKLGASGKWRRVGSVGRLMAVLPFQTAKSRTPSQVPVVAPKVGGSARAAATQSNQTLRGPSTSKSDPGLKSGPRETVRGTSAAEIPVRATAAPARRAESSTAVPTSPAAATPARTPAPVTSPAVAPETDDVILARVRQALDSRNIPGFSRIELSVRSGVVSAQGNLSSDGERLLAIRLLEQSNGVVRVDHQLTVTEPARPLPQSRSLPQKVATRASAPSRSAPGGLSEWIESLKGEYRNHAIASLVLVGVLGYLLYPRGPVRPVAVHPVKGKVIMDGQPLANAAIVLHRVGNSKLPANLHPRGKASSDGTFQLETFDPADGAPDGEFVATVFLTEETEVDGEKQSGPNVLPTVYSKPETSPLKLKITSSTKELQPLELKKG
jgi:hypothetical protein